jgi:hypothetical protein
MGSLIFLLFFKRLLKSVYRRAKGKTAGIWFPVGEDIFLFYAVIRPAPAPTQQRCRSLKLNKHLQLVPRSEIMELYL